MVSKIAVAVLLLTILVSCVAPEPEVSTQVTVLESPQPTPLPERADIGDGGLLSGLPCVAPCVYGIQIVRDSARSGHSHIAAKRSF